MNFSSIYAVGNLNKIEEKLPFYIILQEAIKNCKDNYDFIFGPIGEDKLPFYYFPRLMF